MNHQQDDPAGAPAAFDLYDREAWTLRHRDRLPWSAIATRLDEPEVHVKMRVNRYIAATDAAADAAQGTLF